VRQSLLWREATLHQIKVASASDPHWIAQTKQQLVAVWTLRALLIVLHLPIAAPPHLHRRLSQLYK
jgi:hypothetical protein